CTDSTAPRPHHRGEEIPMHAQSATCPLQTRARTARRRLAPAIGPRYGSPVTVNPVAGRRNPNNERRASAKANAGAFLLPVFYGGCARARFGVAGALSCRFPTPRTAAT